MEVSAIVLAGGRSSRFGRDKLAETLEGETVLARTVRAVMAVATDVVVVLGANGSVDGPADLPDHVRLARDPMPGGGPLVGVIAGLEASDHEIVLIVGGDMPWLADGVLHALVDAVGPTRDAAALESGGRVQQLPIAVRRDASLAAARVLIAGGTRRLGALADLLAVAVISDATWRALDPDGGTIRDIDEPDDLPPG